MIRPTFIRSVLLGILALVALAFFLPTGQAQINRPGGVGRPVGGGVNGMPNGGINGMPNGGNPGGFGAPQGGMPIFETEYSCTNCGKVVGRGPNPPSLSTCPSCGARFSGQVINQGIAPTPSQPAPSHTGGWTGGGFSSSPSSSSRASSDSGVTKVLMYVGVVIGALVAVGGSIMLVITTMGTNPQSPRRKKKRKVVVED